MLRSNDPWLRSVCTLAFIDPLGHHGQTFYFYVA